MQNTEEILTFAKALARDAGAIILEYFYGKDMGVEFKQDTSPVTLADKQINQVVIDRVAAEFPEHGVLAEEGSAHEERNELWVCDPIDGTKSFIQHIPTALFSLAYVVNGDPQVAVIYDPFQDRLYSAVKGEGAQCNDTPTRVSAGAELEKASVGIATSYKELKHRRAFFDDLLERGVNQVIVPGNVFKSSLVISGNIDGYVFPGKSAHDVAAAKLIVEEAGGKVTNLRGEAQRYDGPIYGAVISNGHLHDQLVDALKAFGPENYVGY